MTNPFESTLEIEQKPKEFSDTHYDGTANKVVQKEDGFALLTKIDLLREEITNRMELLKNVENSKKIFPGHTFSTDINGVETTQDIIEQKKLELQKLEHTLKNTEKEKNIEDTKARKGFLQKAAVVAGFLFGSMFGGKEAITQKNADSKTTPKIGAVVKTKAK